MPAAKTNENADSDKFKAKEANCSKDKGHGKMVPAAGCSAPFSKGASKDKFALSTGNDRLVPF